MRMLHVIWIEICWQWKVCINTVEMILMFDKHLTTIHQIEVYLNYVVIKKGAQSL